MTMDRNKYNELLSYIDADIDLINLTLNGGFSSLTEKDSVGMERLEYIKHIAEGIINNIECFKEQTNLERN